MRAKLGKPGKFVDTDAGMTFSDRGFVVPSGKKEQSTYYFKQRLLDFTKATIKQLLDDGYEETKPQMKRILSNTKQ